MSTTVEETADPTAPPPPCGHDLIAYRRGLCRACYDRWRVVVRAYELADEHPREAIAYWDRNRPRSGKTGRARAEGKFGVGPSDLSACPKAVEYRERPPEGYEPVETDLSGAWIGSLLDSALKRARAGRYPWRRFDVKVYVPGLDAPGEADEFDPIIGRVVDFKSAGKWKWDRVGDDGPPEGEWDQIGTYGLGLEEAGEKVVELELIYLNREKGWFESHRRPYDRARALEAVSRLHAMLDALHEGRSLPRTRLGPTVDSICARFCPAVKHCWNLDAVPEGRTPESFMRVHDDDDVAALLAEYLEHHAVARPAEEGKKYISHALLVGVAEGRYGDAILSRSGGNLSDPKPDAVARATQLAQAMTLTRELGVPLPDPATMPYPTHRTTSAVSTRITRVRKATLDKEARDRAAAQAQAVEATEPAS